MTQETTSVSTAPVGFVLGTREATPLDFWVGVLASEYLQLDDVVYVQGVHPERGEPLFFYGLVDQVSKKLEGLHFDSDNLMVKEGILPAALSHLAHVTITRIEPEIFIPPHPGEAVYRAQDRLQAALCFDQMEHKLPAGLLQSGEPAYINYDFVNGSKGGHISISGISGVATKTSYTLFLLHGIFNSRTIPDTTRKHARALIFNVKNEDLLFLDKPNCKLRDEDREAYTRLGLPATPFQDVAFYAPCQQATGEIVPSTSTRPTGVDPYGWTLWHIAEQHLFPFLFNDADNPASNLNYVVEGVSHRLWEMAQKATGGQLFSLDGLSAPIGSLDELVAHLHHILDEEDNEYLFRHWFGRNQMGTVRAFMRRLDGVLKHMAALVRPDFLPQHQIDWKRKRLTVVDINQLSAQAQMFVVGALLKQIVEDKAKTGDKSPVFIVLDELNRYAPRDGWSPIKEILLDIAERGRSMGLILLGAQQTASEVEKRVIANAAIRVNGRLDAAEAKAKEYGYLQDSFRQRATMIRPGTMIVHQPEIPTPFLVHVPMPAWATRKTEVDFQAERPAATALFDRFAD